MTIDSSRNRLHGVVLALASLGSGCATTNHGALMEPVPIFADLDRKVAAFNKAEEKADATRKATDVRELLAAGAAVSDQSCRAWLRALHSTDREVGYAKDIMNIVANAFLGIGGLNRINPTDIGRANIVLGAANASIDTFRAEFIKGAVPAIKEKIEEARLIARGKLDEIDPVEYHAAREALAAYHDICSSMEVSKLLDASLKAVRYAAPDPASLAGTVLDAEEAIASRTVFSLAFQRTGAFDPEQLFRLWVVSMSALGADSALVRSYRQDRLVDLAANAIVTLQGTSATGYQNLVAELGMIAQKRGYQARLSKLLADVESAKQEKQDADAAAKAARDQLMSHVMKQQGLYSTFKAPASSGSQELRDAYGVEVFAKDEEGRKLADEHVARAAAAEAAASKLQQATDRPMRGTPARKAAIRPIIVRVP